METYDVREVVKHTLDGLANKPLTMAEWERAFPEFSAWKRGVDNSFADRAQKSSNRGFSTQGGWGALLGAIPESERKHIAIAERVKSFEVDGVKIPAAFGGDPVRRVAMGSWIKGMYLKIMRPGEFVLHAESFHKLRDALGVPDPITKVALQEDTANEGQELVPTIIENEIVRTIRDNGVMRRAGVRTIPMTSKTHQIPAQNADFTAQILAEEGSAADSIPATPLTNRTITAKKFVGFGTLSNELIQDNVPAAADLFVTAVAEQIARKEDTEALEGDGTNFTGIVGVSGVQSVTSGSNGDRIFLAKLISTAYAAGESVSRVGGAFFMHPDVEAAILQARTDAVSANDGAGVPLIHPLMEKFPRFTSTGLLKNRTVGTGTNRTNVYFANVSRSVVFGDLLGMKIDANPYSKFATFQTDFRVVKRTGIVVAIPAECTKYIGIDATLAMK